jgi:hypothetical protein
MVRHFLSTQRFMHLPGFGFSGRTFCEHIENVEAEIGSCHVLLRFMT